MTEELHKAAQYLCCAGKSYLDHQPDDSHTNMGWEPGIEALITHPLGQYQDHYLSLNFRSYSLEFLDENLDVVSSMHLDGANHVSIVNWIGEEAVNLEIGELYSYDLHYELPYEPIDEEFCFPEPDYNELERLIDLRNLVQHGIQHATGIFDVEVDLRVWPHHFDTGAVIGLDSALPRSIGLGMAIPDSMSGEYYLYVSGWSHDNTFVLDGMPELQNGRWMFPDWNGAILPCEDLGDKETMTFFIEAIKAAHERHAISG